MTKLVNWLKIRVEYFAMRRSCVHMLLMFQTTLSFKAKCNRFVGIHNLQPVDKILVLNLSNFQKQMDDLIAETKFSSRMATIERKRTISLFL